MSEGRDRLRELLDAVLDDEHASLEEMADGAFASPYHFSRQLTRGAGEPPVAMRRRVVLERAAWQLQQGSSVTDAAFGAGYDSVEGFSRAFARHYGHPPSQLRASGTASHWLPAPNGIHFHPPMHLWVAGTPQQSGIGDVTMLMVQHDVDDVRLLLEAAKGIGEERYRERRLSGWQVVGFDDPEQSVARLLHALVHTKQVWTASVAGRDLPPPVADDLTALTESYDEVAVDWLALVRDVERRGAWHDRVVDALCEPPESFVLGSVLAHVLTFSAVRRGLVRRLLVEDGVWAGESWETSPALSGDPIVWLQRRERT
jgi:AraC family transcriptional regulator